MNSVLDLRRQFLEYLEIEKGAALRTVENYSSYLDRYITFSKIKNVEEITPDSVREFRLWLNRQATRKKGQTLSKKTQNYYMIALRVFLKYLTKRGIKSMAADQIELAKTSERSLDLIESTELYRLLDAPSGNDVKSLRDKAILELLFSTGLRVSELCSLPRDISTRADELSVRGKGGKVRVVFVSERARNALKKYLAARKDMEEGLFVSLEPSRLKTQKKEDEKKGKEEQLKKNPLERTGRSVRAGKKYTGKEYGNLDRHSIERIIKHYVIKAGISKKVTPHTMRHLFATDLLSNGADIRSVQALLGHSSIITTQIYTHVTDKHLRDIHKKFHNRS